MVDIDKCTADGNEFVRSLTDEQVDLLMSEDLSPDFDIKQIDTKKYEFVTIKGLIYHVEITESVVLNTGRKILSLKFRLMNNPNAPKRNNFQSDRQYQVALKNSRTGITGTGDAQSVFKKVLGATVTHFEKFRPNYITFIGDEVRSRLYEKIIDLMKKHVSFDYRKLDHNPVDNIDLGDGEFWLEIT